MSKPIYLTDEQKEQIIQEFIAQMASAKTSDGKITFTKNLADNEQKATLVFTEFAYQKMMALVREFDKEIAWHGVAERGTAENEYIITDILVYPQEVSSATVEMDVEKYGQWLYQGFSSGDERFDHLFAQGHSHVNMATSPSSTDLNHQREILADLSPDAFYVFMIWNKKNDHNVRIFDLQRNVMFENADVKVEIAWENNGVLELLEEAKKIVTTRVYTATAASKVSTPGSIVTTAAKTPATQTKPDVQVKVKKTVAGAEKEWGSSWKDDDRYFDSYYGYDDDPWGPFGFRDRWNGK